MARYARKQLADMRAMEEQAERENIVDPRKPSSDEMLSGAGHVVGGGATPSMGLSQVRGGATRRPHLSKAEAKEMGAHLAKYLKKIHGGAYARCFGKGYSAVDSDSDSSSESDNEPGHHGGNVSKSGRYEGEGYAGAGEMMPANDYEGGFFGPMPQKMRERINERGRKAQEAMKGGGLSSKQVEHLRQMVQKKPEGGRMTANQRVASNMAKMQRNEGAMAEAREASAPAGAGKKTRKPAGENDGRRRRAAIVNKVRHEKGLSLIEASKYVKAHGLYTP